MSICNIFKGMKSVNRYTKPIVVAVVVAIIMGIFVGCEEAYTPTPNQSAKVKEPIRVHNPGLTEIEVLSEEIKQLVKGLEYSDKVAEDFAQMVISWKGAQGRIILLVWKQKLADAKEDYKQGNISKTQLAKVEESIAKELSQRIQKEISYKEKFFDLADVIKHRHAQCLSYSQLVYMLGNTVGLSIKTIVVIDVMTGALLEGSHVACIISLANSKTIMIDLSVFPNLLISKPFELKKEFVKVGNYWELKGKDNPLGIHRRIQILDKNGLIACIYNNRGVVYKDLGQYSKAIFDYNKAIEVYPKYAGAYFNRGVAYANLGQHTKAISNLSKAIELNPKDAQAYFNRGTGYTILGQYTEGISDYTKAIELDPKDADAYNNRGFAYLRLNEPTKTISDCTKAIKHNSKYAEAYFNRGVAYANLGQYTEAIFDYNKAIELNPNDAYAYNNRGVAYAFLGKFEEARKDLLKAVELNSALKPLAKKVSEQFKLNLKFD